MGFDDFKQELKNWRNWVVVGGFVITTLISVDALKEAQEANEIAKKANGIAQKTNLLTEDANKLSDKSYKNDQQAKTEFILGGIYNKEQRELDVKILNADTALINATIKFPAEISQQSIPVTDKIDLAKVEDWITNIIESGANNDKQLKIPNDALVKGLNVNGGIPTIVNVEYEAQGKDFKKQNLYIINYSGFFTKDGKFTIEHMFITKKEDLGKSKYNEEYLMDQIDRFLIQSTEIIYE